MAAQEVIHILRRYNEDGGETLRANDDPEAVAAARGIQRVLAARLEEDQLHASLWTEFKANPRADAAELIGVLEALVEADPALARRIDAFVSEYHAAIAPPTAAEKTGDELIAVGGDALDTAKPIEGVQAEDRPNAYAPDSNLKADYDKATPQGPTYLYGNAPSGEDTIGREIGVDRFGEENNAINPADVAVGGVPQLFTRLTQAIAQHPAIDDARKKTARQALDAIQQGVKHGKAANTAKLTGHLHALQRLAPDVAEVLFNALEGDSSELAPPVRRAVSRVRSGETLDTGTA